jgi:phage-related protein
MPIHFYLGTHKMAETIQLPDGNRAPLWATEDTMKDLLRAFQGSSMLTSKSGGGNTGKVDESFKKMDDAILNLTGNQQKGLLGFGVSIEKIGKNFGQGGLAKGIEEMGDGLKHASSTASVFGTSIFAAGILVSKYAQLMGEYLNMLGDAIDVGLGFSANLGDSAVVASQAGLSMKEFYGALNQTGASYRVLGDNAMDAAKNFGALQSSVRSTYGTFGLSNDAMASASADYVKLVAASGLRGQAAVEQAASGFGNSMEQMRKISMATGVSMKSLMGSMKDLIASPIIVSGITKFGMTTEEATIKLAKGAAGFEAVFGKLGTTLYKQMAEAQAAGLSIINTELGAQLAPYTDLGALTKFNKMMQDGSGTAAEMAEAQRSFLSATEANLPTLRLLAQQGDTAAKAMLELYNNAKSAKIMTQEELDGLAAKKRAEEQLLNVQNKIGAAYNSLSAKLFKFLDIIPVEVFETLGDIVSGAITTLGYLATGVATIAKYLTPVVAVIGAIAGIGPIMGVLAVAFTAITGPVGLAVAAIAAIGYAIDNVDEVFELLGNAGDALSNMWSSFTKTMGDAFNSVIEVVQEFGPAVAIAAGIWNASLIPALASSAVTMVTEFIPAMLTTASTMLAEFIPAMMAAATTMVVEVIPAMLTSAATMITGFVGPILAGALTLGAGLLGAAASAWALAAPVLAVVIPFVALTAAVYLVIKHFDEISDAIMGGVKILKDVWNSLPKVFEAAWGSITKVFNDGVKIIGNAWDSISDVFKNAWGSITKVFNDGMKLLSGAWGSVTKVFNDGVKVVSGLWSSISDVFMGGMKVFSDAWGSVTGYITDAITSLADFFSGMVDSIGDWFKNSWIGKKLFGETESGNNQTTPMGSNTTPIMNSIPQNTSSAVQTASTSVVAAKIESTNKATSETSDYLERIAKLTEKSIEQQTQTAKNTASTVDAVNSGSTMY